MADDPPDDTRLPEPTVGPAPPPPAPILNQDGTPRAIPPNIVLFDDNTTPDVVHIRNNQGGVGGLLKLESLNGGGVALQCDANGQVTVPAATATSSPTTGALVVSGGVGLGADIRMAGNIWMNSGQGLLNYGAGIWAIRFNQGNFNQFYDPQGVANVQLNNTANYYRSGSHYFQNSTGSNNLLQLSPSNNTYFSNVHTFNNYGSTLNGLQVDLTNSVFQAWANTYNFYNGSQSTTYAVFSSSSCNFYNPNHYFYNTAGTAGANVFTGTLFSLASGQPVVNHTGNTSNDYIQFWDPTGTRVLYCTAGGTNAYGNTNHFFQSRGGSANFVQISASGLQVTAGGVSVTAGNFAINSGFVQCDYAAGTSNWLSLFQNTTNATGCRGVYTQVGASGATNDTSSIFQYYYSNDGVACAYVIRAGPNTAQFVSNSDGRRKTTLREASERGLDLLRQLPVRDYHWNNDPEKLLRHGFYAQDVHAVYPEAASCTEELTADCKPTGDMTWGIDYGRLTPLITRALQQLADQVEAQAATIQALTARLAQLEGTPA